MEKRIYLIIGTVFSIVILLAQGNIEKAFAVSIQLITTTGTQTNDYCASVAEDQLSEVWLICGSSGADTSPELAIYLSNGTQLAVRTVSGGNMQTNYQMMPSFSSGEGNTIIMYNQGAVQWQKYTYSAGVINLVGAFTPSGCTNYQDGESTYDISGLIWVPCGAEDLILAFNPVSMTEVARSSDLTDAVGQDCDAPDSLYHDVTTDPTTNIVVIGCDAVDNFVTLPIPKICLSTGCSLGNSILDGEIPASAFAGSQEDILVDTINNRIIHNDGTGGMDTYDYNDSTGVITPSTQGIGDASSAQYCHADFYILRTNKLIVCAGIDNINAYVSNSTGFFHVYNTAQFATDIANVGRMTNSFGNTNTWYVNQGSNEGGVQKFVRIDQTNTLTGTPSEPPPEQEPVIVGGVNCSLPENEFKLICRLTNNGEITLGNATGTGLLTLGCNVIFTDCTDTNPATNGMGLLAFIASLFVIVGMFYYTIGREAFHMPIFIWIVIVVALSAFFTITGWIDPIFLILTIVALVAMAVPKIVNITKSGSTLGAGSTE